MAEDNISEFPGRRHYLTTVGIEEVDETWALKLLNECESEDTFITVKHHADDPSKCGDGHKPVSSASLSAIENQQLAFAEKQQAKREREAALQKQVKSSFSLSRIKALWS